MRNKKIIKNEESDNLLLSCKKICVSYESNKALKNISFNVCSGDYISIIGENGSGKSTLLKALLGLTPITSGSITYHNGLKPNEIGYLPQQSAAQKDFPASIYEVVLSGTINKSLFFYSKQSKKIAEENMTKLNITNIKNKSFKELSGGQQQRVLLARALCATEKLLIVDEPTTGLDPIMTKEFYKLIYKLNKLYNITIIMTSHDVNAISKHSNKILHLQNEVLFFGSTKDYLETDYGKAFLGGLND